MTHNISNPERVVRAVTGLLLIGLYGALPAPWRHLAVFGLILLATAIAGNCLLYSLIGRTPVVPPSRAGPGGVE